MRIALVCERFEPGAGGVESVACHLARELGRRGRAPTVVCRVQRGALPPGVSLELLRVPRFWQPLRVRRFSARAAAVTESFDIVHGLARTRRQHIYRAGGGCHAAYMERAYARPGLHRLSPRHRAILGIEEAVLRDPGQLIQCNSRMVAAELRARYAIPAERLVTLYNGVDTEHFRPDGHERERVRAELDLRGPVALLAGSGFRRKGLDRALRGLSQSGVEATLLVAGRDDARPFRRLAARLGVADRVRFLGLRDDLPRLYAAADLFVLPTRYDAFANVCLEAMAAGLAVATTRANGAAELIEPAVNGFLYDDDFAPAFERLADPAKLRDVGRAARQTAEQHSWARHTDAVLELYGRIAE